MELLQSYYQSLGHIDVSYRTLTRRVTVAALYTGGVDHTAVDPQALRGTAATYWVRQGLSTTKLKFLVGWKYITTARNYLYVSGASVIGGMAEALDYDYDRTVGGYPGMPQESPVFEELRADDEDELTDVETWNPEGAVDTPHPRTDDRRDTGDPVTNGGVSSPELPKPGGVSVTVNVTAEVGDDVLDRVARLLAHAEGPTPADAEDHLFDHLQLNDEYVIEDGRDAARVALECVKIYRAGTATDVDGGDG